MAEGHADANSQKSDNGGDNEDGKKGSKPPVRYFGPKKKRLDAGKPQNAKKTKVEIDPEKLKKFSRGQGIKTKKIFNKKFKSQLTQSEKKFSLATEQAARAELLLSETYGSLEAEGIERTYKFSQRDITEELDITSAEKSFELKLDQFGPYSINYTRNGKFLLLGGKKGHLASLDWQAKRLCFETHVQETVRDVKWLHQETYFAAAQKKCVFIYDNGGTEIHKLSDHWEVQAMEFLPYHFLLATIGGFGTLRYLDTSIGKLVSETKTKLGKCVTMAQNPYNAVIHLGHYNGTVTLWSPTVKEPLVKMMTQSGPVKSIAIDSHGLNMVTSGMDGYMKFWDIRMYKSLHAYKVSRAAETLCISQTGMLGVGFGPHFYVFKDCFSQQPKMPYMSQLFPSSEIISTQFCPFEDVVGVGHHKGFGSLLIPGSGEPNFDALESNPYQSKSQRREHEVKMLLDKIQPELITLDPMDILRVQKRPKQTEEDDHIEEGEGFQPRNKTKGKSKSLKLEQRKKGHVLDKKREKLKRDLLKQKKADRGKKDEKTKEITHALDIFNKG